jgi:hypothetical protein
MFLNAATNFASEFNAFFPVGAVFHISGAPNTMCDATLPGFTGYSSVASMAYCQRASNLINEEPYLLVNSGWGGLVLDASMKGGSPIKKLGALPTGEPYDAADWAATFAALPDANLTATLTLDGSGEAFTLVASLSHAVVAPVRFGINVMHIIVTMLSWEGLTSTTTIATPQWWIEVDVWANSVNLQLGWDELAVGGGCGVCEAATVELNLNLGHGVVLSDTASFSPGAQVGLGKEHTTVFPCAAPMQRLTKNPTVPASSCCVVFCDASSRPTAPRSSSSSKRAASPPVPWRSPSW